MVDELALRAATDRAAKAQALMADGTLVGAFETLQADYFKAWRASSPDDTAARERLWQACLIIEAVRSHIGRVIEDGTLAAAELAQITSP